MSSRMRLSTTFVFLMLPGLAAGAVFVHALRVALAVTLFLFIAVWLYYRPSRFVVTPDALEIVWPVWRRRVERASITAARIIDCDELKRDIGSAMRIGAGGLWGGFGWLKTSRRGIVQMYISRDDRFVWLDRGNERAYLLTPERPEEFVAALGFKPAGS